MQQICATVLSEGGYKESGYEYEEFYDKNDARICGMELSSNVENGERSRRRRLYDLF